MPTESHFTKLKLTKIAQVRFVSDCLKFDIIQSILVFPLSTADVLTKCESFDYILEEGIFTTYHAQNNFCNNLVNELQ